MGHRAPGADLGLAGCADGHGRCHNTLSALNAPNALSALNRAINTQGPDPGQHVRRCITAQPLRCRRGNAAQPRPLGNPRQRYWWALRAQACSAISVPRAKAAPRRKSVSRYPTLAYQHEQPSHILYGWQPSAPPRSPCGNGFESELRLQRENRARLTQRSHINVGAHRHATYVAQRQRDVACPSGATCYAAGSQLHDFILQSLSPREQSVTPYCWCVVRVVLDEFNGTLTTGDL